MTTVNVPSRLAPFSPGPTDLSETSSPGGPRTRTRIDVVNSPHICNIALSTRTPLIPPPSSPTTHVSHLLGFPPIPIPSLLTSLNTYFIHLVLCCHPCSIPPTIINRLALVTIPPLYLCFSPLLFPHSRLACIRGRRRDFPSLFSLRPPDPRFLHLTWKEVRVGSREGVGDARLLLPSELWRGVAWIDRVARH